MPAGSMLVSVCVIAMFTLFAVVLYWGDRQTRPEQPARQSNAKRRTS
jgi:hypothetical protein